MTGLYDNQGVLRCAGRDADDCLAYAELFGLAADRYSLEALEAPPASVQAGPPPQPGRPVAGAGAGLNRIRDQVRDSRHRWLDRQIRRGAERSS